MTVANMPRPDDTDANKLMKTGTKPNTKKGLRETYLAPPASCGYAQVSAGTVGGATGAGGKNGTVTASDASLPGMVTAKMGGAHTLSPSGKPMKEGKGGGAKLGLQKGFL